MPQIASEVVAPPRSSAPWPTADLERLQAKVASFDSRIAHDPKGPIAPRRGFAVPSACLDRTVDLQHWCEMTLCSA